MSIEVRYETLDMAADECKRTSDVLTSTSDQLKSDLGPLVNTWEGNAQESYRALQAQWDQAHEELNRVLASIGSALVEISNSYRSMEGQQAQRFGG
jgi:6 kDa early secretory antigenic target